MQIKVSLRKQASVVLVSQIEPKKIDEALKDESWVGDIKEELDQFKWSQVWTLVQGPKNSSVIETRWVYRNKLNEEGKVIKNKARIVAQGYSQQKDIDYDESFTPVARLNQFIFC